MTLKCISDEYKKFFGGQSKVDGITKGKTYTGQIVKVSYTNATVDSDYKFLIYDDKKQWKSYDLYHFEPSKK